MSHRWWVPVATHHLWSMLLARWDNPREGGRGSRSGPHARSESSSLFLFLRGCFRSFVWCHFSGSRFSRWYNSAAFASNGPGGKETGTRIFGRGFSFSSFRRMSSYVLIFALLLRLKICVVDTFDHFSALARLWSFFFTGYHDPYYFTHARISGIFLLRFFFLLRAAISQLAVSTSD